MKAEFETQIEGILPRIIIKPETNAEKILLDMFKAEIFSPLTGLQFKQQGPPWDPASITEPRRAGVDPLPDGTIIMYPVEAQELGFNKGVFQFKEEPILRTENALPSPPKEE